MTRASKYLALLACPLFLAACQVTVLERAPAGASTDCPREWRGAWIALDDEGRDESDFGAYVHADCTVESRDKGKARPAQAPRPQLQFFSGDRGRTLALLGVAEAYALFGDENREEGVPNDALVVYHWERDNQVLKLQPPDHRRIATLVVQGALPGRVRWQGDSGSSVLTGDAAQIADSLQRFDLFSDGHPVRLRRVGDDVRSLERAIKRAAAARPAGKPAR